MNELKPCEYLKKKFVRYMCSLCEKRVENSMILEGAFFFTHTYAQ